MAIRFDRKFSFFCLSLLGFESVRVVDREGVDVHAPGYYVDEDSMRAARVRVVSDILQHSIRQHFGDPEVKTWLDGLGGMRRLDELLVGKDVLKQYIRDLKEIKADRGFAPTVRGERQHIEGVDSATDYDSYAVVAHRELLTKAAFGEIQEDEKTDPSWEGHESNINSTWIGGVQRLIKPFWWNNIYMGRFRVGVRSDGKNGLIQLETSSGQDWVLDIRVSDFIGVTPFKHITSFSQIEGMNPWSEMEDHPGVKRFVHKFYNEPSSLTWAKVGDGDKSRWAAGMEVKSGKWMWSPLTHKSSNSFDWWRENEGKEQEKFYCRALYHGPWVIAYRKSNIRIIPMVRIFLKDGTEEAITKEEFKDRLAEISDGGALDLTWEEFSKTVKEDCMNVRMFKECLQTGWLAMWKETYITWQEWGAQKKRLMKLGAKDAYFGKPWKKAEYQQKDVGYADL